jgi:hypothetical protein
MCGFAAPCAARISSATGLRLADYNIMAIATQKKKLKEEEESRNFFCVMSDAFRLFARRSSAVLGGAWAFASAKRNGNNSGGKTRLSRAEPASKGKGIYTCQTLPSSRS